jgi:hypothetical protein
MRYSIMLQLVTGITLILVAAIALFAWFQNRQSPSPERSEANALLFLKSIKN